MLKMNARNLQSSNAGQNVPVRVVPASLKQKVAAVAASVVLSAGVVAAPAHAGSVSFANLNTGASVEAPVHVEFQVSGMEVRPAKDGIIEGTGHFHLIVDDGDSYPAGVAIPFDETHKHYGKGQLEDDLYLPPGRHTLTLQFANAVHQSYGPEYAQAVKVTVK